MNTVIILPLLTLIVTLTILQRCQTSEIETISKAINDFDANLRPKLFPQDNLIYSPFSIFVTLVMILVGAQSATKTQIATAVSLPPDYTPTKQFGTFLKNLKSDDGDYILQIANRAYVQNDFQIKPTYSNSLQNTFLADILNADFANNGEAVMKEINDFVKTVTNGVIDSILASPLDPSTVLALINAIYFKGTWVRKFDESKTEMQDFTALDKSVKQVPMMTTKDYFQYGESKELKAQVVELPYVGQSLSMVIVLPNEGVDISTVDSSLTASVLQKVVSSLKNTSIFLSIPKYELETSLENLKSQLQDLGMVDAFDASKADLTGISDHGQLAVGEVIHKAKIIVNEEGSEAAAVTIVTIVATCFGCGPPSFTANRPFLAFIMHKESGVVLFSVRFVKPPS